VGGIESVGAVGVAETSFDFGPSPTPFTALTCDNLPSNGRTLHRVLSRFAELREPNLGRFVAAEVACPATMLDRIVPATTDDDRAEVAAALGLKDAWPAALVAGGSFALVQFFVSNFWGPYAVDVLASLSSIVALTIFLRFWRPQTVLRSESAPADSSTMSKLSLSDSIAAWTPWMLLGGVMVVWSYFKFFQKFQFSLQVPGLHNGVFITLYSKLYPAVYDFQPLAAGTAALTATLIAALFLKASPRVFLRSGLKTLLQLRLPGLTVLLIVALAYTYNYSGMAYTLGAALAGLGKWFPLASGFLGWVACFLTGSDTASNLLFGNLQVAAAHQVGVNPILLAATNSSGAVAGKMISPQNIAVGVTTVGLAGQEGAVLRDTFWHSILLAGAISVLAFLQAYVLKWMVP